MFYVLEIKKKCSERSPVGLGILGLLEEEMGWIHILRPTSFFCWSYNMLLQVFDTIEAVRESERGSEGEKTTGGGISELSLSQRSWKAKRWGDGRIERGGGWGGRELAHTTEPSSRE